MSNGRGWILKFENSIASVRKKKRNQASYISFRSVLFSSYNIQSATGKYARGGETAAWLEVSVSYVGRANL